MVSPFYLLKDKMARLKIAIQNKGRLYDDSMNLIKEAGFNFSLKGRELLASAKNFPIDALFLRDDDIPQTVSDGVADVGIVGENEVIERGKKVEIIKRLGFSKCHLSLAIPRSEEYKDISYFNDKKIATSYPGILKKFLKEYDIKADIHVITGSVEIAPGIGLADAIFDIVSSGSTLVSNRLKEVEKVMYSEALLIGYPGMSDDKKELLKEFFFRLDSVQRAEGKKYIMLNAPDEKVSEIAKILPGMKSPTVTPLEEKGWSSLQSVIAENDFWEIIGKLKKAGAQSILVLPIEKMIF